MPIMDLSADVEYAVEEAEIHTSSLEDGIGDLEESGRQDQFNILDSEELSCSKILIGVSTPLSLSK